MNTTTEMTNFMGGTSFKLFNPLTRLKLVAFSSFLGEPTYYQKVENELFEKRSKTFDCDITFLKNANLYATCMFDKVITWNEWLVD